MAPGVSAAIRELVAQKRLNATSVMTVSPNLDQAAADALAALNNPDRRVAIGLHVTLTAPYWPVTGLYPHLRGGIFAPLTATLAQALLRRFDADAVATEVEAQFAAFERLFGRPPDFVDGHQHVHVFPQIREAFLSVAKRRAPDAWVRQCGRAQAASRPLGDPKAMLLDAFSATFRRRAQALGVPTNPAFAGTYVFDRTADYAKLFPSFLHGLPAGGLVMCHPGHVDAELERLDPVTHLREREYAYLAGSEFPRVLATAGMTLSE